MGWQERDADLALLDGFLRCLFNTRPLRSSIRNGFFRLDQVEAYDRSNVWRILAWTNGDALHEELIATSRIQRRVFFHRLEQDCVCVSF